MSRPIKQKLTIDLFFDIDDWVHILKNAQAQEMHLPGYIVTLIEDLLHGVPYSHINVMEKNIEEKS